MKKITYLKETFSDYGSFEGEFREVFDTENNVFIESTCGAGKTFHAKNICLSI